MPKKKEIAPVEIVEPAAPAAPVKSVIAPSAPVPPVPALPTAADGKPGSLQIIAVITLINGILNVLWGMSLTLVLLPTLFCWPVGAYPLVLGILEIIYAAKLLPNPAQSVQPSVYLAVMEIVDIIYMNPFALIGGILALVFYSDPQVKAYFAKINSQSPAVG